MVPLNCHFVYKNNFPGMKPMRMFIAPNDLIYCPQTGAVIEYWKAVLWAFAWFEILEEEECPRNYEAARRA